MKLGQKNSRAWLLEISPGHPYTIYKDYGFRLNTSCFLRTSVEAGGLLLWLRQLMYVNLASSPKVWMKVLSLELKILKKECLLNHRPLANANFGLVWFMKHKKKIQIVSLIKYKYSWTEPIYKKSTMDYNPKKCAI